MNLIEPILYQCKLNPFATAIATPGSGINSVKYGQLDKLIHNVARAAIKAGLTPGEVAAIAVSDPILHAVLILGLMRIGVVTMSLLERDLPDRIAVNAIITDAPQQFPNAAGVIAMNASWLQGDATPPDYERIYRGKPDDICRILLTSGSTGRQKGIALSHAMMMDRIAHYGYAKGALFARISRFFCGFGIASTPGYMYLLYMLCHGGTTFYAGGDLSATLQYLEPYQIEGFTASPYDLDGYLKFFEADPSLKCNFDLIICQGAKLSRELSERARVRLCQNLFTSYGSTETLTTACGPAHIVSRSPGAVGFVCPGVKVEAVDSAGRVLPSGQQGSLRIRSPHLANGYVGDPEATAQMFRDGAFYSGDLGYMNSEGLLIITGREKTALSVSGDTVAPEIVEEILCGFAGIEQAAAFNLDDAAGVSQIHALIVGGANIDDDALRAHCEARLRSVFIPKSFIKVDAIPRGGQGKIDRPRVAEYGKAAMKQT